MFLSGGLLILVTTRLILLMVTAATGLQQRSGISSPVLCGLVTLLRRPADLSRLRLRASHRHRRREYQWSVLRYMASVEAADTRGRNAAARELVR